MSKLTEGVGEIDAVIERLKGMGEVELSRMKDWAIAECARGEAEAHKAQALAHAARQKLYDRIHGYVGATMFVAGIVVGMFVAFAVR